MTAVRVSRCLAALAAALLSACASTEPAAFAPQPSAVDPQSLAAAPTVVQIEPARIGADEPVCRRQNVTGSHRPRVVCQTAAQRSATREAAQEWYRTGGRTGEISQVPVVPTP
jgi:hypothetical protein